MTLRARLLIVVAAAVVLVGAVIGYIVMSRNAQKPAVSKPPVEASVGVAAIESGPRIVFRSSALGPSFGTVAMVPLSDPGGPRAFTKLQCDRVFATQRRTLCLASDRGVVTTYSARVYTKGVSTPQDLRLTGSPSRARLSSDGEYAATTSFVAGDSYAATSFSTRTVVTPIGKGPGTDLEDFALFENGHRISPIDRNYWGVTFSKDDDLFYVTVAYGGSTHLAKGRLSTRRIETMGTDAECPSLSPDETRVAYKKRGNRTPGDWRLVVRDLATGQETELAERRSVDDQVEWLDDSRILYGLPGEGSRAAESNVWVVNADGSGEPSMLITQAWSPAVVR